MENTPETIPPYKPMSRRTFATLLAGLGAIGVGAHVYERLRQVPSITRVLPAVEGETSRQINDPVDRFDRNLREGKQFVEDGLIACNHLLGDNFPTATRYPIQVFCVGSGDTVTKLLSQFDKEKLPTEVKLRDGKDENDTFVVLQSLKPVERRGFIRKFYNLAREKITRAQKGQRETEPIGLLVNRVVSSEFLDSDHPVSLFLDKWEMGTAGSVLGLPEDKKEDENAGSVLMNNTIGETDNWKCVEQVSVLVRHGQGQVQGRCERMLYFVKGESLVQIRIVDESVEKNGKVDHLDHGVEDSVGGNMNRTHSGIFTGYLVREMTLSGLRDIQSPFFKSFDRNVAPGAETEQFPLA